MIAIVVRTLLAASSLACMSFASAQNALPVSACFNDLLVQKTDFASSEQLSLATLSVISENTYASYKSDKSFTAIFPFMAGSADFTDFSEKRRSYFQENRLNLDYYRSIAYSSRTLGDKAYGVLESCIDKVGRASEGFYYFASSEDETASTVQFFWHPQTNGGPIAELKVVKSVLENALVVGGPSDGTLFEQPPSWALWKSGPRIGIASEPILLRRIDPTKVIRISLTVEPKVKTNAVNISPVPAPKKYIKKTVIDEGLSRFDVRDVGTKIGTRKRGTPECSDCDLMTVDVKAAGKITEVACDIGAEGSHLVTKNCYKSSDTATWIGRTNDGNSRIVLIKYKYEKELIEEAK